MSPWLTSSEEWLVRSSLAGGVLLLLGVGLMLLNKQPARRQRLGELALGCSLLVALLCTLPSWTPWTVPLWSEPATPGKCVEPSRDKPEDFLVLEEPHKLLALADRDRGPLRTGERSDTAGFVFTREVESKESRRAIAAAGIAETDSPAAEPSAARAWSLASLWSALVPWLVAAYVLFMAALFVRFLMGHIGLRRLWAASEPPPSHVQALLAGLTWDWRRPPRLGVSTQITLPVSFGLWRPTILIPWSFCKPYRRADLRQVLVHELTHLQRLDAWSCVLVALGQAIYYHLPWFWWVRKQVRLCQEYVADAAAAALSSTEDYAEYLVSLSGYAAPRLPVGAKVMGVKGTTSDLFRRVTMLLNASREVENRPPRWWSLLTAGAFLAVGVLMSGIGLRSTARADERDKEITIRADVVDDEANLVLWLEADPQDEGKFIVVSPKSATTKAVPAVVADPTGKRFIAVTSDGKDEHKAIWVQADPKEKGRFFVTSPQAKDGEVRVWAYTDGKDGKGEKHAVIASEKTEGRRVQTIDLGDGKKLIIIIEDSGSKSGDKKEPLKQLIERKIEIAKPKGEGPKPEVKFFTKPDADKAKQQADEAVKRALELLRKSGDNKDVDAARKALEEALRNIEKERSDLFKKSDEAKHRAEIILKAQVDDKHKDVMDALKKAEEALRQKDFDKLPDDLRKKLEGLKALQGEKAQEEFKKAMEAATQARKLAQDKVREKTTEAEKQAGEAEKKAREAVARFRKEAVDKPSGMRLGVQVQTPGEALAAQLDLGKDRGLVIDSIAADTPAAKAGFQPHDVLVEFNGQPVSSDPAAFVKSLRELKSGAKVDAVVLRKGKRTTIRGITLADAKGEELKFEYKLVPSGKLEFKGVKELDLEKELKLKDLDLKKLKELDLGKEVDPTKFKEVELDLSKVKFDVRPLEKIKLDKLEVKPGQIIELKDVPARVKAGDKLIELDKDVLTPVKPGDKLFIDTVKPAEKPKSVKLEVLNPIVELKEVPVTVTVVGNPEVNLDELVKVTADGKSKSITISCTRDNDKFTTKYQEDKLTIEIKGTITDGKAKASEIVLKDGDTEHKHAEIDKFPEQYRAKLKELIEMSAKGKFEVKTKD